MTMPYRLFVAVLLVFLQASICFPRAQRPTGTRPTGKVINIRRVDFLNFDYPSTLCHREFAGDGLGARVRVRKGKFDSGSANFGVVSRGVSYGDLTGDSTEEAVVETACGLNAGNYALVEIFVYTVRDGSFVLLGHVTGDDMLHDYERFYKNDGWFDAGRKVSLHAGKLLIECDADGSHAEPLYVATLEYAWNGSAVVLVGSPTRRPLRPLR